MRLFDASQIHNLSDMRLADQSNYLLPANGNGAKHWPITSTVVKFHRARRNKNNNISWEQQAIHTARKTDGWHEAGLCVSLQNESYSGKP